MRFFSKNYIRYIFMIFTIFIIVFSYYLLITNVNKGLDITDESYYILRAANPELYNGGYSNFGICTGVLYKLSSNNIVLFRLFGLLIIVAASGYATWQYLCFHENKVDRIKYHFIEKVTYTIILSFGSTTFYFSYWLPTPSYNWLLFLGTLLIFGSIFLFFNASGEKIHLIKRSIVAAIIIGFGGFLLISSNPLAAFMVGCLTLILIFVSDKEVYLKTSLIITAAVVALTIFLIYVFTVSSSMNEYIEMVQKALKLSAIKGGGHTVYESFIRAKDSLLKVINPLIFFKQHYLIIISSTLLLVVCEIFRIKSIYSNENHKIAVNIIIISIIAFYICTRFNSPGAYGRDMVHLLIVVFLLFIEKRLVFRKKENDRLKSSSQEILIISLLIFLFPIFMRFGTGSELISVSFSGAYFYCLLLFIICSFIFSEKEHVYRISIFLIITILLLSVQLTALEKPYRLITSVGEQVNKISIPDNPTILYVDNKTKIWVETLQQQAFENGWQSGDYLLDFTGGSPGAVVLLNGRAPGAAWLIGGYEGSNEFVYQILSSVDENIIRSAWILTAPNGSRKISNSILDDLNIEIQNYKKVAEVVSGHRNEIQELWKP